MFPNLEAEQARQRHSNSVVAEKLGITRQSFEHKKKSGTFKFAEIQKLLDLYESEFKYLFSSDKDNKAS
ncbi:MAG: hypothetical protein RR107_07320 [Clostridia bacterium]